MLFMTVVLITLYQSTADVMQMLHPPHQSHCVHFIQNTHR